MCGLTGVFFAPLNLKRLACSVPAPVAAAMAVAVVVAVVFCGRRKRNDDPVRVLVLVKFLPLGLSRECLSICWHTSAIHAFTSVDWGGTGLLPKYVKQFFQFPS